MVPHEEAEESTFLLTAYQQSEQFKLEIDNFSIQYEVYIIWVPRHCGILDIAEVTQYPKGSGVWVW